MRVRVRPIRGIVVLSVAGVLVSCGEATAPVRSLPPCARGTIVRVGAGLRPEITWTPRCRASTIGVFVDDGSGWVWLLRTGDSLITPPVRVGSSALRTTGSKEIVGAGVSLAAGQRYVLMLNQWTNSYGMELPVVRHHFDR